MNNWEEEEDIVECQNCGWTGHYQELVALTDDLDDKDFSHCPRCDSDDIEDWE